MARGDRRPAVASNDVAVVVLVVLAKVQQPGDAVSVGEHRDARENPLKKEGKEWKKNGLLLLLLPGIPSVIHAAGSTNTLGVSYNSSDPALFFRAAGFPNSLSANLLDDF